MMAVLTSRGFSGLGHDGLDALTPLLDLLNYVRGGAADRKGCDVGCCQIMMDKKDLGKELSLKKEKNGHHAEKKVST